MYRSHCPSYGLDKELTQKALVKDGSVGKKRFIREIPFP